MIDIPRIDEINPCYMPDGHWIDRSGDEVWIKDGNYYRVDGPAIIYANGRMDWFINNWFYRSIDDWLEANNEITDSQKVLIKLKYG